MKNLNHFTSEELATIRDALEMRSRGCIETIKELEDPSNRIKAGEVPRRLILTFQHTKEKADRLIEKLDSIE